MSRMADLDIELRSQKREILHAVLAELARTERIVLAERVPTAEDYARDIVRMLNWEYLGGKRDHQNKR